MNAPLGQGRFGRRSERQKSNGGAKRARLGMPMTLRSLSARLLVLTVLFIMLCEVFVYVPSIARYRLTYLKNVIADAHLAMLSLEAAPAREVSPNLTRRLLRQARAHVVVLHTPGEPRRMLIEEMPPQVTRTYDLREAGVVSLIWDAFAALVGGPNDVLRVIDRVPGEATATLEVLIDEGPLRRDMIDYSERILILSLLISFFTATLVFISLHWLLIRPLRRLTQNMIEFSADPDDPGRRLEPSGRGDEIGIAEQELANMQAGLRAALKQNARLAALGAAVTKINHDLRNMLASAQLVSDRLAASDDPQVKRVVPTLVRSIDRAVRLCTQTLDFARGDADKPKPETFSLDELVEEAFASQVLPESETVHLENHVEGRFAVTADRGQVFRALANLVRNAVQAGAGRVAVEARRGSPSPGGGVTVEIVDDGPGIPDPVREALFEPFHASASKGGSGLGLAIAREIVEGHGGSIELVETGASGTRFRFVLPNA